MYKWTSIALHSCVVGQRMLHPYCSPLHGAFTPAAAHLLTVPHKTYPSFSGPSETEIAPHPTNACIAFMYILDNSASYRCILHLAPCHCRKVMRMTACSECRVKLCLRCVLYIEGHHMELKEAFCMNSRFKECV